MKSKRLFQILVLLMLLLSPFGVGKPVHASANLVNPLDRVAVDRNLPAAQNIIQSQATLFIVVNPSYVNVNDTATVTVFMNSVPTEGYTSIELTCTYNQNVVEASNIVISDLFGEDPVTAINGPQDGHFIAAIAGSHGNKAVSAGIVLAFNLKGLMPGHAAVVCQARVSQESNELISIGAYTTGLTVLGGTPTPSALCDQVQLIADVTVPDGTILTPGAAFTKTWRLKNIGSCVWTTAYQLVFDSGEQMGASSSAYFPVNVEPGEVVDISLSMTAPAVPGPYRGYWMFKNASGQLFGTGAQADKPWWVAIQVAGATLTSTPTLNPTPCDKAELVADITIPPGTPITPGALFLKTWRLKNVGSCTWTTSYRIAFYSGEQMRALSSVQLPVNVVPGQTVDLSLNMTAPSTAGSYRGYWIFQNADGQSFGVGPLGNEPWFVDIRVSDTTLTPTFTQSPAPSTQTATPTPTGPINSPTPSITPGGPTATPSPDVAFDFAALASQAAWFSGAGQLPYPGIDGNPKGFVLKIDNPQLENGVIDTRPGLLTVPQNVQNGYIQGFYSPFHVQNGDRFRASIGCASGATNCYLAFRLDYQIGSDPIRTFWGPFLERYDGRYFSLDLDLSPLAGRDVRFILTVLAAGTATGDRALWVGPIIYRPGAGPTPTSTPTSTLSFPTFTPSPTREVSPTPTDTPSAIPEGAGHITGRVRADKTVVVNIFDAENVMVTSIVTGSDGVFNHTISPGRYTVIAAAEGFLSARGFVTVTEGTINTMPVINLLIGDIDDNNVIDQFDALTIGMNYNTSFPPAADLNRDGIINVLDLELLAKNYRKTGPVDWQ